MRKTQMPGLYIMFSENKGRGVFTSEFIPKDSIIELAPIIILNNADTKLIHETKLHDYYFVWDIQEKTSAIALGYGSIYNHSDQPNTSFELNFDSNEIKFSSIRNIESGEELLINYIDSKEKEYKLWFETQNKVGQ